MSINYSNNSSFEINGENRLLASLQAPMTAAPLRPDTDSTQPVSPKSVSFSEVFPIPVVGAPNVQPDTFMVVWAPHSAVPCVDLYVLDPRAGGTFHFLRRIKPSEDLSENYVMQDLCSGIVQIISNTTSGTTFNVSGTLNAAYIVRPPALGSLTFATLLAYASNSANQVPGVTIQKGVTALAPMDDDNRLQFFETPRFVNCENGVLVKGNFAQTVTQNIGVVPADTVVYDTDDLLNTLWDGPPIPANATGHLEIDFSFLANPVPNINAYFSVTLEITLDGASPATWLPAFPVERRNWSVPAVGNVTVQCREKFYFDRPVLRVRVFVSIIGSTAILYAAANPDPVGANGHIHLTWWSINRIGQVQPVQVIIGRGVGASQTIELGGKLNYAVVAGASLQRQVKPVDMTADQMDTVAARVLANSELFSWVMPTKVYEAALESPSAQRNFSRENTYETATRMKPNSMFGRLWGSIKPRLRDIAPALGRAAGGAAGIYLGNPMLGQTLGENAARAMSTKYLASTASYRCSTKVLETEADANNAEQHALNGNIDSTTTPGGCTNTAGGETACSGAPKCIGCAGPTDTPTCGSCNRSIPTPSDNLCAPCRYAALALNCSSCTRPKRDYAIGGSSTGFVKPEDAPEGPFRSASRPLNFGVLLSKNPMAAPPVSVVESSNISVDAHGMAVVPNKTSERGAMMAGKFAALKAVFEKAGTTYGVAQFPAIAKDDSVVLFTMIVSDKPLRWGREDKAYQEMVSGGSVPVYFDRFLQMPDNIAAGIAEELRFTRAGTQSAIYVSTNMNGAAEGTSWAAAALVAASWMPSVVPMSGSPVELLTSTDTKLTAASQANLPLLMLQPDPEEVAPLLEWIRSENGAVACPTYAEWMAMYVASPTQKFLGVRCQTTAELLGAASRISSLGMSRVENVGSSLTEDELLRARQQSRAAEDRRLLAREGGAIPIASTSGISSFDVHEIFPEGVDSLNEWFRDLTPGAIQAGVTPSEAQFLSMFKNEAYERMARAYAAVMARDKALNKSKNSQTPNEKYPTPPGLNKTQRATWIARYKKLSPSDKVKYAGMKIPTDLTAGGNSGGGGRGRMEMLAQFRANRNQPSAASAASGGDDDDFGPDMN